MQINSISNSYNTSFNAVARKTLTSGATLKTTVKNNASNNIKEIAFEIWSKGKLLQQTKDKWASIGYDTILQSDYLSNVSKKLGLTEESDEEAVNDTVFEAYIDEMQAFNENESDIL